MKKRKNIKKQAFEKRQAARKDRLRIHQERSALLMRRVGGYNSSGWAAHIYGIKRRIEGFGRYAFKKGKKDEKID